MLWATKFGYMISKHKILISSLLNYFFLVRIFPDEFFTIGFCNQMGNKTKSTYMWGNKVYIYNLKQKSKKYEKPNF